MDLEKVGRRRANLIIDTEQEHMLLTAAMPSDTIRRRWHLADYISEGYSEGSEYPITKTLTSGQLKFLSRQLHLDLTTHNFARQAFSMGEQIDRFLESSS